MIFLRLLFFVLSFVALYLFFTQIVIPLLMDRPLFPFFVARRKRAAEREAAAVEEEQLAKQDAKSDKTMWRAEKIREKSPYNRGDIQ